MLPAGNVVGGVVSSVLLAGYGWKPIYLIGGLVPALLGFVILALVPESISFLARHANNGPRIAAILRRLRAGTEPIMWPQPDEPAASRSVSVAALVRGETGVMTAWIWAACFCCWMVLLVILSWTAPLLQQLGISPSLASLAIAANSTGGILGAVVIGRLMDRLDRFRVCFFALAAGAVVTGLTGLVAGGFTSLAILSFAFGFTVGGGSSGVMAIIATAYPDYLRATGVGWAIGVGRLGAAIGPVCAGLLLKEGVSTVGIFEGCALPCLISAAAILRLRRIAVATRTT